MYRRRNDGKQIKKGSIHYDNRYVVPYNLYLLTKYDCHINLEICNSIQAVKYLYKYVYKGSDHVSMSMETSENTLNNQILPPNPVKAKNEIKNFTDSRYVSASEASWRIFNFKNNNQYPSTVRLDVDLEDEQSCIYDSSADFSSDKQKNKIELKSKTQLTEFFKLNSTDIYANSLLYHELPKHYTWNESKKTWTKRIKNKLKYENSDNFFSFKYFFFSLRNKSLDIVGRLKFVHPINEPERYALRTLLLYRKGATSYADLKTVDGVLYHSNKSALIALGFAADDNEYYNAMDEVILAETNIQKIRELFAMIIMHCNIADPLKMWNKYKNDMTEDILQLAKEKYKNQELLFEERFTNMALHYVDLILRKNGKNVCDYNLPTPSFNYEIENFHFSPLIKEELSYNIDIEQLKKDVSELNQDQKYCFDSLNERIKNDQLGNNAFFIDGPGGTI